LGENRELVSSEKNQYIEKQEQYKKNIWEMTGGFM
jgi:hypothetical protein